ncbi:MAG TPA: CHASE domain-containing protein [Oscillatoriaceae cyanobacterium M33_DOE_052]|uniref:Circadian input-output histidine kinase CikA n=1 Tax=Planktothricoides sp. SpSt-374 TaxID=2282167 RepID=A0A7C3ZG90_9CYAN|nr:CHASE domain-containing protein [Oscillatoriaceae cyanobacterium M33_DOE_052]
MKHSPNSPTAKSGILSEFVDIIRQTPLAIGVLLLGLSLTGSAWYYTNKKIAAETKAIFDRQIEDTLEDLNRRIQVYVDSFYGARGLWQAENLDVSYSEWKLFTQSVNLEKRYPGIRGFGFIRYVPENREAYEAWVRQNHSAAEPIYRNYTVKPLGNRSEYFVIEYCEPIQSNQGAIGFDIAQDPIRSQGAQLAIDKGQPAATGPIVLSQDQEPNPGVLIYLPIYRAGMPVHTVTQKRRAFFGFIYGAFRVKDLIEEGIDTDVTDNFYLVIYNRNKLIYGEPETAAQIQEYFLSQSQYHRQFSLNVAGEKWNLYWAAKPNIHITSGDNLPGIILSIGTLISFLLFGIILSLKISYTHVKAAKEASDAASRSKSQFLANMSHELRTPLNAILGFAQIMSRDTSLTQEHRENIDIINRSGEHLLSLIGDILDMSKIEAGLVTINETCFDLYAILEAVEDMFSLKAKAKGLMLEIHPDPSVPQYVKTDEAKLRQVLINLMGNAIKFTAAGGVTVRVVAQKTREIGDGKERHTHLASHQPYIYLHFEIEDTGPGIAAEEIDTLFTPFVQTQSGRKSLEGTGLGLPISRQFVQLMGGDIQVKSAVGVGTVFGFDIKAELAAAASVKTTGVQRRAIALAPGQPLFRILIVDDRWENCRVLSKLLQPLGFDVREAANGKEAIEIWSIWSPHLIWMDMRMPVMNGMEATKQIKATAKGQATVIIALSASAFEQERESILASGCNDFVRKPFRQEVILEKMKQYLGVEYIYEDANPISYSGATDLTGAAGGKVAGQVSLDQYLSKMPSEWVAQLHQAALELNARQTLNLLAAIPQELTPLGSTLASWLHEFRFDKILELTANIVK